MADKTYTAAEVKELLQMKEERIELVKRLEEIDTKLNELGITSKAVSTTKRGERLDVKIKKWLLLNPNSTTRQIKHGLQDIPLEKIQETLTKRLTGAKSLFVLSSDKYSVKS